MWLRGRTPLVESLLQPPPTPKDELDLKFVWKCKEPRIRITNEVMNKNNTRSESGTRDPQQTKFDSQ